MTLVNFKRFSATFAIVALVFLSWSASATGGPMRLVLNDGNSIEVPYYWVTDAEYKFDIPGGIAGVPRAQVASIQEVLVAKEFDPEVLVQSSAESTTADQRKLIQDLVAAKASVTRCEIDDPEEGLQRLRASQAEVETEKPMIRGQSFKVEKTITTVCDEPGGPVLMIQELTSSSNDLRGRDFSLLLYDSEGRVISRKPCEVYPLTLDQDAQKKLGVKGKMYLIRASIKPDAKIKRYEIASVAR